MIFQQPDFLGLLVDARGLTDAAHQAGALAIACVDPISLAILAPPGEYGADIAAGEGQQLGLSLTYAGPPVGARAFSQALRPPPLGPWTAPLCLSDPWECASPPPGDTGRRGGPVTLEHPRRSTVNAVLWEADGIPDYRGPDGFRIGLSPLSTSFEEVRSGIVAVAETLEELAPSLD